ncbi:acid protease [Calocera cornea HHB12733]|uniref:Acid protease n=1 Tax=Calocera cornea HHB12733 TaxID=1353952 RepID=A0A165FQ70_9BASI|nr:acid protease [Calocera cornea HHB12733]
MQRSTAYAALALLATELLAPAAAISFDAHARYVPHRRAPALQRRDTGTTGVISIGDVTNVEYTANVTVNGQSYLLTIDTGSSDLNIEGSVPNAQDHPEIEIDVTFAEGAEDGVLSFGTVEFAGHTVQNQAFSAFSPLFFWPYHVPTVSDPPVQGLVGLGPSVGSEIWVQLQSAISAGTFAHNAGDSLLDRIFQQDTTTPNFISFTLSRDDNAADAQGAGSGTFTVGDVVPGYENITSMPQLDVLSAPNALLAAQHFTIQVDGATGPNSKSITFPRSNVSGVASGKLVAVLDSGFTFPQVPAAIASGFYAGISGSQLVNINGLGDAWIMPCSAEVDASFTFAGHTYPMHPLDLNQDPAFAGISGLGNNMCLGGFQPIQDDATEALAGLADMILGMGFLRNTYTLMNYGDFVDSNADARAAPFVQLLSVTNPNQASIEFHNVRGGQPQTFNTDGSTSSGGGSSSSGSSSSIGATIHKFLPIIIAVPAAILAIVIGVCVFCCVRRRRQARAYQTLGAPAPGAYPAGGQMGYAPYQSQRNLSAPYGVGASGRTSPYEDPFRDTTGPSDTIPLAERNAEGRFGHSPSASREFSPLPSPQPSRSATPQPPRAYGAHSPSPSYSAPYNPPSQVPYDPPQVPYTAPAAYAPPAGAPPGADPYR